jgi:tRNA pseudouridine38-40 synthase
MFKYAVLVTYVGSDFCGWQKQKQKVSGPKPSVQEEIEVTLRRITGETFSVVGSGRTDAGVHALGQVAHFILRDKEWDPAILLRSLNGLLPPSIRILAAHRVALDFHAQRSAEKKQYSYYFQQGPCSLPRYEPYSRWIRKRLNEEAMQTALSMLVGEHDFKAFQSSGSKPGPTVRKILTAEITRERIPFPQTASAAEFELVRIRLVGTGFLKQMVRGIAGTLLQVGEDRRPAECFREILASRDRQAVGPTAPARALWLEHVWYPASFGLPWLKP